MGKIVAMSSKPHLLLVYNVGQMTMKEELVIPHPSSSPPTVTSEEE